MQLDKELLLNKLNEREEALRHRVERDFGGGLDGRLVGRWQELRYWIGAIERSGFDIREHVEGNVIKDK